MDVQEAHRPVGFFSRRFLAHHLLAYAENRGAALLYGTADAVLAFLFARTHAVFGAYPFAIGYLAAADRRVLPAFVGALLGALTLGSRGYVYAVAYAALLFLRLFLSYPRQQGGLLPPSKAIEMFVLRRNIRLLTDDI